MPTSDLIKALILLVLCLPVAPAELAQSALADDPADGAQATRPKIGVVLSGGGARGAAHIGVLQVLEEKRIPVDYIAGTSMGSIVAGIYATSLSTDKLLRAVHNIDWNHVLADPTPRRERSFRRKRDDDLYLVKAKPGIDRHGLKFPAGVIQGQRIDLALSRYLHNAAHVDSYDDFAIPYRAIATDIETGKAVVLKSGNLPRAIRASMSVPAIFSPAIIDGRKLVDGGVANNLPVDVVRDMGADIVIAVDISTPLLSEVNSVLAITEQLTSILTRGNTEAQISTLTPDDVLIVPDLGDITSGDFVRVGEAVPTGREAAEATLAGATHLSLSAAEYAAWRNSRTVLKEVESTVEFIQIDNRSRLRDSIIANRIVDTKVGEPLDIDAVEKDIGRVYGLEIFQNVGYDILEKDGEAGIEFWADERSWGPAYLQLGGFYNSNGDGDNVFNVGVAYLHTGLNPSGGEARVGLQFGEEPGVFLDYHQPVGRDGMYFFNTFGFYGQRFATNFVEGAALSEYRIEEALIEGSFGREFGTWGQARAGLRYSDGDAVVRIGDPLTNPDIIFQRGEVYAQLFADELDSSFFPTEGFVGRVEWTASRNGLGADQEFEQLELDGLVARSFGKHTLALGANYGATISGHAPIQSQFRAGGFGALSGYNQNELSGQHFGVLSAIYYRRFGNSSLLPAYAGFSVETGNVWQERDSVGFGDRVYAGNIFVGADSPLGPIYVAYGLAEQGQDAFYVYFGNPFGRD